MGRFAEGAKVSVHSRVTLLLFGLPFFLGCGRPAPDSRVTPEALPTPSRTSPPASRECLEKIPAAVVKLAAYCLVPGPFWKKDTPLRSEVLVLPFTVPEPKLTDNFLIVLKNEAALCAPGEAVRVPGGEGGLPVELPGSDEVIIFRSLNNLCLLSPRSELGKKSLQDMDRPAVVMAFSSPYVANYKPQDLPRRIRVIFDYVQGPKLGIAVAVYPYQLAPMANQENYWMAVLQPGGEGDSCGVLPPVEIFPRWVH